MASNDSVGSPSGDHSSNFRPWILVGIAAAFTLGIYYGSQLYISWRFSARVEVGLLDFGIWFDLLQRLSTLFQLELAFIGTGALGFMIGVLRWFIARWKSAQRKPSGINNLHGSARWATREEIQASGLLPRKQRRLFSSKRTKPFLGVVVGGWQESPDKPLKFLKDNSKNHILVFAPTRTGKGVSIVLPTLLDGWRESALVYDPKGELWAQTAAFRRDKLGQRVYKFDPAGIGPDVAKFNPLAEIRLDQQHEVADCQNLAQIISDPDGVGIKDFFNESAYGLLTALILHVCYVAKSEKRDATFGDLERWFGKKGESMKAKLENLLEFPHRIHNGKEEAHPSIVSEAQINLNRAEKELSAVVSTANSKLTLFRDPTIIANTGRSDFMIDDLIDGENPASVYLSVRTADRDRLTPLIRIVLTQIIRKLTSDMDFTSGQGKSLFKHRLLLLLDEFTSLNRLTTVEGALKDMAGYGIKALLICQDLQQLKEVYGPHQSIVSNCTNRVCFASNEIETAKIVSEWAGTRTIVASRYSQSAKKGKISSDSVSKSVQEHRRSLILPDEFMRLPAAKTNDEGDITEAGDLLIFLGGSRPIYGKQPLYFKYPELVRRSTLAIPDESHSNNPRTLKERERRRQEQNEPLVRTGGASGAS